ncbi:hypothetical protein N9O34_00455 [Candidatus Pelagibacter sp.]|nr:hypothetical protein [Candidatus Pelagibacter sp.]
MKAIKKNYTNFILTVIAVAMVGILFKGSILTKAHASHYEINNLSDLHLNSDYTNALIRQHHHKTAYLIKQICGG